MPGRQSGGASDTISTAAATELAEGIKALLEDKIPVCDADVAELRAKVTFVWLCATYTMWYTYATHATGRRSDTTGEVFDAIYSVTGPSHALHTHRYIINRCLPIPAFHFHSMYQLAEQVALKSMVAEIFAKLQVAENMVQVADVESTELSDTAHSVVQEPQVRTRW